MVLGAVLRSRSIFDWLRVFLLPAQALVKKKCFKNTKKMNNSTFNKRKKTFLGIIYLFVHVGTQEHNIVQNFFSEPVPVRLFKTV